MPAAPSVKAGSETFLIDCLNMLLFDLMNLPRSRFSTGVGLSVLHAAPARLV